MRIVVIFLRRFLLILVSLAGAFFLLAIALGKMMQQKEGRDTIRRFNQKRLNPVILRRAGKHSSGPAALTHIGRRSGHIYTTPVVAIPFGEVFVIPLPYGVDTDWCRNVLVAGKCALQSQEQEYLLEHPEIVPLTTVIRVFPFSLRITATVNGLKQCLMLHLHRDEAF